MGGSYKQCVGCGKRALSIATRCPGCGREFLAGETLAPVATQGPGRRLPGSLSPRVAGGVLAATAILTLVRLAQTSAALEARSSTVTIDSVAASTPLGYEASGASAQPMGELLVARDWTSVRKSRSKGAELEAVLEPGDTVFADSLEQGWYRVALYGEVLGYAHHSLLTPPAAVQPAAAPAAAGASPSWRMSTGISR